VLYDNLKDILKHTRGFFESVKISNVEGSTLVEAINEKKTVVLSSKLVNTITEIEGCIGFTRMDIINGLLNFPAFTEKTAKIEFVKEEKGGETVMSEINFDSGVGHNAVYRFMPNKIAERQIQVPPFKGVTWDVIVEPTKKNLSDLSYFYGILGAIESDFAVSAKNGKLDFKIGGLGADRSVVPIATGITGSLSSEWSWPFKDVIDILKLGETSSSKLYISNQGALKIEINSGLGVYEYILPASSRK